MQELDKKQEKNRRNFIFAEILSGDRKPTEKEARDLDYYKKLSKEYFYIELIYILTHKQIKDGPAAVKMFNYIVAHKEKINLLLGRNIGIQVAALDYLRNIRNILKNPVIIEEQDSSTSYGLFQPEDKNKTNDTDVLYHDFMRENERVKRYGSLFSLLFLAVDNLCVINETYTYEAGDVVLRTVGEIIKGNIRSTDTAYRLKGDKFAVLLPSTDLASAREVSWKLMTKIRNMAVLQDMADGGKNILKTTVTLGITPFNKETLRSPKEVFDGLDASMLKMKKKEKNKIYIFDFTANSKIKYFEDELKKSKAAAGTRNRFVIKGSAISSGLAIGRAFIYKDALSRELEFRELLENEIESEIFRIKEAIKFVLEDIKKIKKSAKKNFIGSYYDIFDAHAVMLSDPFLMKELEEELKNTKLNAEQIIKIIFRKWENRFKTSKSDIVKERADDIADLSRRLIDYLTGQEKNVLSEIPEDSIIVAKRLLPSDTLRLEKEKVKAIITEAGSKSSHASIIARSLGIPCISRTGSFEDIPAGSFLIVDTDRKEIIVNPGRKEQERCRLNIGNHRKQLSVFIKRTKSLELKKGEQIIEVMANANSRSEITEAMEFGAAGIGLFRLEQIYMRKKLPLSENELFSLLDSTFKDLEGKEINLRLLDIGGDKNLTYLDFREEENPLLGLRGVRVLIKNPDITEIQLKVILKLSSKYKMNILIPMVTLPEDIVQIRTMLEKCKNDLRKKKVIFNNNISLGAMIEVPAAVIRIKEILKCSDFVSIGTNDLIQYVMAASRETESVSNYYDAGTDIVLDYIRTITEEAARENKKCSLCGEIAADINYTGKLLEAGLNCFSVSCANVFIVKNKIAELLGLEV